MQGTQFDIWSKKIPHSAGQQAEPVLWSQRATTTKPVCHPADARTPQQDVHAAEARAPRAHVPQQDVHTAEARTPRAHAPQQDIHTADARTPRAHALQQDVHTAEARAPQSPCSPTRGHHNEKPTYCKWRVVSTLCNKRKPVCSNEDAVQTKINKQIFKKSLKINI